MNRKHTDRIESGLILALLVSMTLNIVMVWKHSESEELHQKNIEKFNQNMEEVHNDLQHVINLVM
jgi:hypothetical protein